MILYPRFKLENQSVAQIAPQLGVWDNMTDNWAHKVTLNY